MKRNIITSFLLLLNLALLGQEIVFEKDLVMKAFIKDERESFPIVNYENNEIVIFLLDYNEIKGLRFNMNYELTDEYSTGKPAYKKLLGHSIDANGYQLFYSNEEDNEFYTQFIDIVSKTSSTELKTLVTLKKNEKYLETVSYNNKFYLLTCIKGTSVLQIYVFEGNSLVKTKELNFSSYKFSDTKRSDLYSALMTISNVPFQGEIKIQKIDISNPNSIEIATCKNKIYYYDNKIYFSIDNEQENTKLITIDLRDFSNKVDFYNQVDVDCEDALYIKSNSYLYLDKLYQIKGCYIGLGFQIVNIEKDSIVKVLRIKEDEEINFRNTPLMLEKNESGILSQDTKRKLSTKQLLRKIADSDIGITANLINDKIQLTIGGYKDLQNRYMGGTTMSSGGTVPTLSGSVYVSQTYHYNPTMYGFMAYKDTRAVYFKSILDSEEYNHIEGEVPENAYDLIKKFKDANENSGMKSLTVFKVNNYYIFGYYNRLDKKYYLRRFEI